MITHDHPTKKLSDKAELNTSKFYRRDRDRTDDLYCLKYNEVQARSTAALHGALQFGV